MALDFEMLLFVLAGFFIAILVFFVMLRYSNARIVKKFLNSDSRHQKTEEKLAKLSVATEQNTRDLAQIKKILNERKESRIGPYDESIAKPVKRTAKSPEEDKIRAEETN